MTKLACILLLLCFAAGSATANWSISLSPKPDWYKVLADGSLLISTDGTLSLLDAASGEERWRRSDIRPQSRSLILEIEETSQLLVPSAIPEGLRSRARRALESTPNSFEVIDRRTGRTVWQLRDFKGELVGLVPLGGANLLLGVYEVDDGSRDERGLYLAAYNTRSGAQRWLIKYANRGTELETVGSSSRSTIWNRLSLPAYPRPVISGGTLYVPWLGLHAIDLNSGNINWRSEFDTLRAKVIAGYAAPIIDGGVIYAAGKGTLSAFDIASGNRIWQARIRRSPQVMEIRVLPDRLIARLGGVSTDGREIKDISPLAVIAIDRQTGEEKWRYSDVSDGITNLVIDMERDMVMFADAKGIVGLNLSLGSPQFETPLQFFRTYGKFKAKSGGFSIGGGFSQTNSAGRSSGGGGMLGMSSSGLTLEDMPLNASVGELDLILRGQHHIMAFDPDINLLQWSILFGDPDIMDRQLAEHGEMPTFSEGRDSWYVTLIQEGRGRRTRDVLTVLGVNWNTGRIMSRIDFDKDDTNIYLDHKAGRLYRFDEARRQVTVRVDDL